MTRRDVFARLVGVPYVAKALPTKRIALADVDYQMWHATVEGGHIFYTPIRFHRDAFVMTWPKVGE